jgi:hypothetical protein
MQIKIEKNLIAVDNYKQICNINNDLIVLEEVKIVGENLKIKYLDKNRIIIVGVVKKITFGDD